MGRIVKRIALATGFALFVVSGVLLASILSSRPKTTSSSGAKEMTHIDLEGDRELAHLLVKLELKTRAVIAGHYTRSQSSVPGIDIIYKRWLAKNAILPAAVADGIFSEVVPQVTGGRAWVKMVVEEPRNPNNRGDAIALEILHKIQEGKPDVKRSTGSAYYYAEPIKASKTCLPCHGESKGDPDPLFPQYTKNGWQDGDIVGAVMARVAPEKQVISLNR